MSHLPPALARRIDRLSAGAHAFHRFAHHPLCAPYAGELIHLGRRGRLCRGCVCAALGAAAGFCAAVASPVPPPPMLVLVLAAAVPVAWAAVRQPRGSAQVDGRRLGRRRSKTLTRAVPLAFAAALVTWGLRARSLLGAAVAAAALGSALAAVTLYRRRGPDRTPCRTCPESSGPRVCSGFRAIARREAAFVRKTSRLLRDLPPPRHPTA